MSTEAPGEIAYACLIILHCVEFYPTLDKTKNVKYPLINVWNVVALRQSHNYELAMRLETSK